MTAIDLVKSIVSEDFVSSKNLLVKNVLERVDTNLEFLKEEYVENHYNEIIFETLTKKSDVKDWIEDFVDSKNPKFEGKNREERIKMALAAYFNKQQE